MIQRLILCETLKPYPKTNFLNTYSCKFLGYDYAYTDGSYYSSVFSDIVAKLVKELNNLVLNNNQLFNTLEEIQGLINLRQDLEKQYDENVFEKGDFIIYKLSEVKI